MIGEDGLTGVAVGIDAAPVEGVGSIRDAFGQGVELGPIRGEIAVPDVEQRLHLTAGQGDGTAVGPGRGDVASRRIVLADELARVHAVDQVRAADEDGQRPVRLGHRGRRDDRAQLLEKLLALVQQVVGMVAGDGDPLDLAVEAGDLFGHVVDRRDLLTHLAVDAGADHAELGGVAVHLHRQ